MISPLSLRCLGVVLLPVLLAAPLARAGETGVAKATVAPAASAVFSYDLEERLRFEARSNNRDFNDALNDATDDSWLLSRFRLGVTFQPTSWLKLYGQVQDTQEWNSERPNVPGVGGTEGGDFDLRLASVEIGDVSRFPVRFTVGRLLLDYGDARLVADPKWGNFGRTFDGVKLHYASERVGFIDAWAARPVQIKEEVINDSDRADHFFGLYAGLAFLSFQTTDFYVLYRDKGDNQPDLDPINSLDPRGSWNGPAQRITTIGTRWKSNKDALGPWDYTLELAGQFGEVWTGDRSTPRLDHRAFAGVVNAGYTFDAPGKPRIGLEYAYASGDRNPDDTRSQSFQNLFPSNHAHYGFMDEFGWRNLHDARISLRVQPARTVTVTLDYHALWLADTRDYWYRSNGFSTLRTRTPDGRDIRRLGADSFAGQELDLTLVWKPHKRLSFLVGYSHFFAGDYLRDTGPSDDADFGYVQGTLSL